MKRIIIMAALCAVAVFAQSQTRGTISEFHAHMKAETMRALGLPGGWMAGDTIQVFARCDLPDVNQLTVSISFWSEGAEYRQTRITAARRDVYSLVAFTATPIVERLKVTVEAQRVEPREAAVFE